MGFDLQLRGDSYVNVIKVIHKTVRVINEENGKRGEYKVKEGVNND